MSTIHEIEVLAPIEEPTKTELEELIEEEQQLGDRINAFTDKYAHDRDFNARCPEELKECLMRQLSAMTNYSGCLAFRIKGLADKQQS